MTGHVIYPGLRERAISVALVGAGGTGCQVLTGLARLHLALRALGHPGGLEVTVFDPDRVSESNVGRQLYYRADVGLPKCRVLTDRVNTCFGLDWRSIPAAYPLADRAFTHHRIDILISCVDSAQARRDIHADLETRSNIPHYWLDLGNREQDGQAILGQPRERDSVWGVQAVKGKRQPKPPPRLPMVTEIFPDLLDESIPETNAPSCSLAEALESQDLFVNQAVATWGLELLWRLLRDGQLRYHGYFISLESGRVNPLPVPTKATKKRKVAR